MNGVTGRMGWNQHLNRSILPIIRQGGVKVGNEERVMPRPVLVGRNADKLEKMAKESGIEHWSTDLDSLLSDEEYPLYFDAQRTDLRVESVKKAIAAGKHIYCEKPSAETSGEAVELYKLAEEAGVRHGVVQDKLWLPGLVKLRELIDQNFFGKILSVRVEFGYWVFEGDTIPAQRPSWNYRKEDGGGITLDMFCHWRYLLDNLFGGVKAVSCRSVTHVDRRVDEDGQAYEATADDAVYALFELEGGVIASVNSSWATRVRRDDLLIVQVDGAEGSAVAGLRDVWIQPYSSTPKPVWNPDLDQKYDYRSDWIRVPDRGEIDNAFKIQWELFFRHLVTGEPFRWNLLEAARGSQLAELGIEASEKESWIRIPDLV